MFSKHLLLCNLNEDGNVILGIPSGSITQCGSTSGYKNWNAITLSKDVIAVTIGTRPNEKGAGIRFQLPDGKVIDTGEIRTTIENMPIFLPKGTVVSAIINGSDRVYATCYHGTFVEVSKDLYLG